MKNKVKTIFETVENYLYDEKQKLCNIKNFNDLNLFEFSRSCIILDQAK